MELEVGGVCKAFIAVRALEGSLTRVGAFMLLIEKQQEQRGDKYEVRQYDKKKKFIAESVQAVLTCLRFDVCEKDFEQMEQV